MGYLDMVKGRLYTYKVSSLERRSAQSAMYEVINVLTRIMCPILTFTSEEIWQDMAKYGKDSAVSSVHLLDWPISKKEWYKDKPKEDEIIKLDLLIIPFRPNVAKKLEELRNKGIIGSSFDAKINLLTNDPARYTFLESLKSDLCEIFKVSQVEVKIDPTVKELTVEALNADGKKCVRCWNYSSAVGKDKTHSELCDNCLKAIG